MGKRTITRRGFVKSAGAAAGVFMIVPRHVLGLGQVPPSEKLNVACIGLGWPGCKDVDALAPTENIVALCDVDSARAPEFRKKYEKAKNFIDYRRMLDEMGKSIDAVIVATPDHTHAVLAVAAMKLGKHVYCEKPLAHSIREVREMMKVAKAKKVITQMGNQGHASDSIRLCCEWIWDGAIGNVHTIHAGCSIQNTGMARLAEVRSRVAVPANLDWDLWLGPAAERPYHPAYLPETWRGWAPFGDGTIGDWTCHVVDPVFWALDLGAPSSVVAEVKDWDPKTQADVYPKGEVVTFEFAAKETAHGKRGPVKLVWHTGSEKIPRPAVLEENRTAVDTGAVVYGDKGAIMYGSHGAGGVRIIPEAKMREYKHPKPSIARVPRGGHEQDWARAIKAGGRAGSDFSYGGPLTEIALVGVIAIKLMGTKLEWDGGKMEFVNNREANALVAPQFRAGWGL
ncbi:MAG TPA: Gfo/Idh/MocA family oxidoreductase [Tepidisphaeraceae bacterium]|jgi:predicted dehydrogenase|nr:Gfo/Idh/MocA family oxidoreductase [Tepidisphaeraceae bacterium]HEV8606807.1 Gfo/Idh/MocA family oxidoreductase [Tepidisphaeraceae bacterium]